MSTIFADQFVNGVELLLHDYLGLRTGDSLLIRSSEEAVTHDQGQTLQAVTDLAGRAGIRVTNERVSTDTPFDPIPVTRASATVYATRTVSHHRRELKALIDSQAAHPPKIMRLFDFSRELFETGMKVRVSDQKRVNDALISRMASGKLLTACSETGSNLEINVSGIASWTNSYGKCGGKFVGVLPTGEINSFCSKIDGVLCLSGAVNTNFGWIGDARLAEGDLVLEIENGVLADFRASRVELEIALRSFFSFENAPRVGELGIGTNTAIDRFVPFVSHINERHPGLHLGFGTPTQVGDAAAWPCPVHLDFIAPDCNLYLDGEPLFIAGRFVGLEDYSDLLGGALPVVNLVDTA